MQTIRIAIFIGAAALALGGCGKKDEVPAAPDSNVTSADVNVAEGGAANMASVTFSPGQAFANAAASSDAFEIQSSQMALASASSAAVKKFAQQMIDAHTQSTTKLKAAAAKAAPAITPDPAATAEQQAMLDGLKGKTGAAFDEAYVAAQRDAHRKTLDALRGYAAAGDEPSLKDWAAQTVPTVAAHLNMAEALKP
jgi:putative membrane protein